MGWVQDFRSGLGTAIGLHGRPPVANQVGNTPPPMTYGPGSDPSALTPNYRDAGTGELTQTPAPSMGSLMAPSSREDGGFHLQRPAENLPDGGFHVGAITPPPMVDGGFHRGPPHAAPNVPVPQPRPLIGGAGNDTLKQTPQQSWNVYSGFGGDQGNPIIGQMAGNPGRWVKPGQQAPQQAPQPVPQQPQAVPGSGGLMSQAQNGTGGLIGTDPTGNGGLMGDGAQAPGSGFASLMQNLGAKGSPMASMGSFLSLFG